MELTIQHNTFPLRQAQASKIRSAILRVLLYFDIFDYPLTAFEIFENSHNHSNTLAETVKELKMLESLGIISKTGNFYYLQGRKAISCSRPKIKN